MKIYENPMCLHENREREHAYFIPYHSMETALARKKRVDGIFLSMASGTFSIMSGALTFRMMCLKKHIRRTHLFSLRMIGMTEIRLLFLKVSILSWSFT